MTHTFRRIRNSTNEAIEFFSNQPDETVYTIGVGKDIELIGPNNYINQAASDFFFPGRYEHTMKFKHSTSDCFDIEEKFIYDFEFDKQVFQIDIANRFYLGEKLEFSLKNFIV